MSLSTFFTKAAATKTVRLATVPALAVAGVALAAGPALADSGPGAQRVGTAHAVVAHGEVSVSGYYLCTRRAGAEELRVTVAGADHRGRAEATREVWVACTGQARSWELTLVPSRGGYFTPGVVRVDAALSGPREHAYSSTTLFARGI